MKRKIKRWTALAISILTTVAIIIMLPLPGTVRVAGIGKGENARIEKMEGLAVALQEIFSWYSSANSKQASITEDEFHSARIQIQSSQSQEFKLLYSGSAVSQNRLQIEFTADYYINDQGQIYIETKAELYTQMLMEDNKTSSEDIYIHMDAKIYEDEEALYVYYDEISLSANGVTQNVPQLTGKWLSITETIGQEFFGTVEDLYAHDFAFINVYCQYIRDHLQEGFRVEDNVHTMEQELFQELCRDLQSINKETLGKGYEWDNDSVLYDEGSFSVDLTDAEKPRIETKYHYTLPSKIYAQGYWFDVENTGVNYVEQELVLCNLNNINITFPDNVTIYDIEDVLEVGI